MPRGRQPIHKDALLEGALRCLQEKGFARTTARDIVAAADANLGAIGYHYGSTAALLNKALLLGFERWTEELEKALRSAMDPTTAAAVLARELPATFDRNRPLVRALLESMAQYDSSEELREGLIANYARGRELVTELIPGIEGDQRLGRTLSSLVLGLYDGLLFQWLIDPENAPTADDLLEVVALLGQATGAQAPD